MSGEADLPGPGVIAHVVERRIEERGHGNRGSRQNQTAGFTFGGNEQVVDELPQADDLAARTPHGRCIDVAIRGARELFEGKTEGLDRTAQVVHQHVRQLRAQRQHLPHGVVAAGDAGHGTDARAQLRPADRLAQEVRRPGVEGPRHVVARVERRHHDDGRHFRLLPRAHSRHQCQTVHPRHHQIGDDDVGSRPGHRLQRLGPRGRKREVVRLRGQETADDFEPTRLVVDHQDT